MDDIDAVVGVEVGAQDEDGRGKEEGVLGDRGKEAVERGWECVAGGRVDG